MAWLPRKREFLPTNGTEAQRRRSRRRSQFVNVIKRHCCVPIRDLGFSFCKAEFYEEGCGLNEVCSSGVMGEL